MKKSLQKVDNTNSFSTYCVALPNCPYLLELKIHVGNWAEASYVMFLCEKTICGSVYLNGQFEIPNYID